MKKIIILFTVLLTFLSINSLTNAAGVYDSKKDAGVISLNNSPPEQYSVIILYDSLFE